MTFIVYTARVLFILATLSLCLASCGVLYHHSEIDPNKGQNILFATIACIGAIASWHIRRRRQPANSNYLPVSDLNVGAWRKEGNQ